MSNPLRVEGFHAVEPKKDCPHCTPENIAPKEAFQGVHVNDECPDCAHRGENWVCLKPECRGVRCSRYVNSHMVTHNSQNPDHPICFSFADFSFWCYSCDSYVVHDLLNHTEAFYLQKFGQDDNQQEVFQKMKDSKHQEQIREEDEDEDEDQGAAQAAVTATTESAPTEGVEEEKKEEEEPEAAAIDTAEADIAGLVQGVENLTVREPGDFTYEDLVKGLKERRFKRILVMTGAGISVSAGIPDFRSPGTGIYDNLAQFNLPHPEAIFALDYFNEHPEAFYKFAQHFDLTRHNATPTHYFIKMLQDKGLLWKNMTQNIDNLEEKTGIDMSAVIQAHGANRGAACANRRCNEEQDFETLQQAIRDQNVMSCAKCTAPVKPNIVFFGEALPQEFADACSKVKTQVDLCLIMGTALAVSPFNVLPVLCQEKVPKVLFNMENTRETGGIDFLEPNRYKLFVQGKCDETIRKLATDCGWETDFENVLPDFHKTPAASL